MMTILALLSFHSHNLKDLTVFEIFCTLILNAHNYIFFPCYPEEHEDTQEQQLPAL